MRPSIGMAAAIITVLSMPALAQDRTSCLETQEPLKAIRACSEIVRSRPKDATAYQMRGDALAKNGDLGQAIADYSKAIQLNPHFAAAYSARAQVYAASGDHTRAAADATKATELSSQKAPVDKAASPARSKPKAEPTVRAIPKTASRAPMKPAEEKKAVPVWIDGRLTWQ